MRKTHIIIIFLYIDQSIININIFALNTFYLIIIQRIKHVLLFNSLFKVFINLLKRSFAKSIIVDN